MQAKPAPEARAIRGNVGLGQAAHGTAAATDWLALLIFAIEPLMTKRNAAAPIDDLRDRRLFLLHEAPFDAFVVALQDAPAPGPKLNELLARKTVWEA